MEIQELMIQFVTLLNSMTTKTVNIIKLFFLNPHKNMFFDSFKLNKNW